MEGDVMKIIIHSSCKALKYNVLDGREIIFWGDRYAGAQDEYFINELQEAIDNQKSLSSDCKEEPGIFIINHPEKGIMLYSDFAVPVSFYYSVREGNFYCGNTDKKVADLIEGSKNIDKTGVYQRLCIGYTIGHRTRYHNVSVLTPGSIVFINDQVKKKITLPYEYCKNVSLKDTYEAIREEVSHLKEYMNLGLMLSAGYDSRILLSACIDSEIKLNTAYTHGLMKSLELNVAYNLAKEASVDRIVQVDAGKKMFGSRDDLQLLFNDVGCLYNTCWRLAGEYFKAMNILPICGVQAEILNGQYLQGSRAVSNYKLKYNIARHGYDAYVKDKKTFTDFCLQSSPQDHLIKFTIPEIQEKITEYKEDTQEDLMSLSEIYRESCQSWSDAFIRFLCEHDGAKLMAQQAEILRRYTPVVTPFTGRKVVTLCNSYKNKDKIFGRAMRQILNDYAPRLAKYRCTKSLLPATAPDWLYIIGRTLTPVANNRRIKKYLRIKGDRDYLPVKNTWEGGDVWLRDDNEIDELKELLTGTLLNIERMNKWLDEISLYKIGVGDGQDLLRVLEHDLLLGS